MRPGEVVQAWAYNGMVPGPRIDLDVGDQVEVEVTNELPLGTDVHWHGVDVPNGQDGVAPLTQELIASGETYTYRFTVEEAGSRHVPRPRPRSGRRAQRHVRHDLRRRHAAARRADGLGAGDAGRHRDRPGRPDGAQRRRRDRADTRRQELPGDAADRRQEGDWIQVSYYNEGLQVHPMHLHGFEQIVIAKDGEPLDHPYAADTVLVAPGERYTVIFNANSPGTWVWHCHILNHVESSDGMFGMVTAVIVNEPT